MRKETKKVVMVGTGYVGLVSGTCFAHWGHDVICVDIDDSRIDMLNRGIMPIYEPGLEELVATCRQKGQLHFSTDLTAAAVDADIVMIAVGTPPNSIDGGADLCFVFEAGKQIARALTKEAIVVTKSTVPVGTSERLETIMRSAAPRACFHVASNPEFLREGSAVNDFNNPDRVVIGVDSDNARDELLGLYEQLSRHKVPVIVTSRRSAELIKYASNAFLATKIAFINEMADLCERVDARVDEIALGMGLDKRIGEAFLQAGPGYGGSCFPKDTTALLRSAQQHGVPMRLLEETVASNTARKRGSAKRLHDLLGGPLYNRKIAILGLTFKANTDDMRESPSLPFINNLLAEGAIVHAHDPCGMLNAKKILQDVTYFVDPYECAKGADALVLMTDWDNLRTLDFDRLGELMHRKLLLDLRGVYNPQMLQTNYGFTVDRVGYPGGMKAIRPTVHLKPRVVQTKGRLRINGVQNLQLSNLPLPSAHNVGKELSHDGDI